MRLAPDMGSEAQAAKNGAKALRLECDLSDEGVQQTVDLYAYSSLHVPCAVFTTTGTVGHKSIS